MKSFRFKKSVVILSALSLLFSLCTFTNCSTNAVGDSIQKNRKTTSTVKKSNYAAASFSCNTSTDTDVYAFSGEGTVGNPFIISSSDDLKCLSFLSNAGNASYSDKYSIEVFYKQTEDIDLGGSFENQWVPISSTTNENLQFYGGGYNGNGKTIRNLYISPTDYTSSDKAFGLFGFVRSDVAFENINFENINITISNNQPSYIGSVVGKIEQYEDDNIDAKLTNIHVKSGKFLNGDIVGGIAGFIENAKFIENCTNNINIFLNTNRVHGGNNHIAGGLVGFIADLFELKNASNTGTIQNYNGSRAGGIIGNIDVGCYTASGIHNTGAINGYGEVGGLFGGVANFNTFTDCYNTGAITNTANDLGVDPESSTGGLFGHLAEVGVEMHNLYNTGNINGGALTGGIGGWQEQSIISDTVTISKIYNLYNCGAVIGYERTAGLFGQLSGSEFTFTDSYNVGNVSGNGIMVGGIIGKTFGSGITIKNIYNVGTVSTSIVNPEGVGGIVGEGGNTTDWTAKTINSVLSLSKYVAASNPNITHRIYGNLNFSISDEGFYNNYAYFGVSNNSNNYSSYTSWVNDDKSPNGKNASCENVLTASFYTNTLKFNTEFWSITNGRLPILKTIPNEIQKTNLPSFFNEVKCPSNTEPSKKTISPKFSKIKQKGKKVIFYFKKGNVSEVIKIKYKKKTYKFKLKAGKTSYSIKVKSLNKKLKLKLKKGKKIKKKLYIYIGSKKYKKKFL